MFVFDPLRGVTLAPLTLPGPHVLDTREVLILRTSPSVDSYRSTLHYPVGPLVAFNETDHVHSFVHADAVELYCRLA